MSLSICMICKNEEKNIDRCLNSIKSIADEIVVVDTGSTDRTIDIIKSHNTKLLYYQWDNDFSSARNISIQNATSDWILILDADEEIDSINCMKIKELLGKNQDYEGFYFNISNITNSKESSTGVVLRLFKRNPLYKFEGKLHEQIIDSIFKYKSQDSIKDTDIKILHYGYDIDKKLSESKSKRNLDILLSYKDSDKNGYYYYTLGNEYIRTGNFEKCIECLKKSIDLSNFPNEFTMYFPYLIFNLVKLLIFIERIKEAFDYFNKYIDYYSDFKDFYFLGSVCALRLEKYTKSKKLMEFYKYTNPTHNLYPSNDLSLNFNIEAINNAIEDGLLIEQNPINDDYIPLVIGIINTCTSDKLPNCLNSIKKLNCDKILLTTQELIDKKDLESTYNLTILNKSFENDYSHIKNQLLNHINENKNLQNKWILILDSNEFITHKGITKLKHLLNSPNKYKAYTLELVNQSNINYKIELRLFIQDSRLYYRDKMYEEILTSAVDTFGKKYVTDTDIQICSFAHPDKIKERKEVFNSYKEYEEDDLYYFYKGNDYFKNNDFINATLMYKKSLSIEKNLVGYDISSPKHLLALNLCVSLLNIKNYMEALYYSKLFLGDFEGFATLYIIKSYCEKLLNLPYLQSYWTYLKYKDNNKYPFIYMEHLICQ